MENKKLAMTMLYDFFGELLTPKQREYFELYYDDDLSLAEIAENEGITRQGVRDILRRAEASLRDTEEKTGIVARFLRMQARIAALERDAGALVVLTSGEARHAAGRIVSGLGELKGW